MVPWKLRVFFIKFKKVILEKLIKNIITSQKFIFTYTSTDLALG